MIKKPILYLLCSCLSLSIIRIKLSGSLSFTFLIWNISLAIIPLVISSYLTNQNINESSNFKLIFYLGVWLLFLPNAPYIITDFIHLRHSKYLFIWYDILLIFVYASTGFILAIISINQMTQIIKQKKLSNLINVFLVCVTILCGFGVYLGRVLRFNSWDIFSSPFYVLKKSILSFSDKKTWLITLGFAFVLYLAVKLSKYYSLPSTKSCK